MYEEIYFTAPGTPLDPWTRAPIPPSPCATLDDAALLALILSILAARPHLRERLAVILHG